MKDRKNEFIEGNKTICQDDCDFSDYDFINQYAKCKCSIKESPKSILDLKINKTKLYENFIDIKNIANIKILACYKVLFRKNSLKKNIACFSVLPIILLHLIAIIIFYSKEKKKINKKINDIIFAIRNWYLVKAEKKGKGDMNILETKKKIRGRNKQLLTTKETRKRKLISSIKNNNKVLSISSRFDNHAEDTSKKKKKLQKKKRNKINLINNNLFKNRIFKASKKKKGGKSDNNNDIFNKKISKEKIVKKAKKIMEYNNEELNNLSYNLAKKYDKRKFCKYYLSLVKTRHVIIFSFFYNNDYNARIIKIDLFFISFVIYFTINAVFFDDNTMHKIYEDEGSFNIVYQLPQIVYSSLISFVLDMFLKLLSLSEANILVLKKNKEKKELDKREKSLNKTLNIKFCFYFIISTILLTFFWYYLSMFCAIYRNTQYHLIKDTLISFGLSLIYPFGIHLLPAMLRIPALSNRRKKRDFLYKISLFFQMLA